MFQIDVLTLFPQMFKGVLGESIIKRAQKKKIVKINVHNLRDWSADRHKKVDDKPYGGGPGMILSAQPIFDAVRDLRNTKPAVGGSALPARGGRGGKNSKVILLSPQGKRFNQRIADKLAKHKHLILICGHYEGIDERVRKAVANEEISIGDYVVTGGELPAMVLIDAIVRLLPGVLGNRESTEFESFSQDLLEYPQYTRPRVYEGLKVPEVLLRGDHKKIEEWRYKESLKRTKMKGRY